jgi:hypothetical protein
MESSPGRVCCSASLPLLRPKLLLLLVYDALTISTHAGSFAKVLLRTFQLAGKSVTIDSQDAHELPYRITSVEVSCF